MTHFETRLDQELSQEDQEFLATLEREQGLRANGDDVYRPAALLDSFRFFAVFFVFWWRGLCSVPNGCGAGCENSYSVERLAGRANPLGQHDQNLVLDAHESFSALARA